MADVEDFVRQTQEGLKYLLRKRKTKTQEMEEAVEGGEEMQGERRFGHPRTDEERRERHKRRFGTEELPPRGTGLMRRSTSGSPPFSDKELEVGYRKI